MRKLLLVSCCLLVAGCTRDEFVGVEGVGQQDTTTVPAGTRIDKLKAKTVIIQYGQGSVAAPVDNTKAGQKHGTAATGTGSSATSTQAGTPWWVFAGLVVIGIVLGFWGRGKLAGRLIF
jgi:hypothetical protein